PRRRLALASAHDDIVAQSVNGRASKLEVTVVGAKRTGERKALVLQRKRSGAAQHEACVRTVEKPELLRTPCETCASRVACPGRRQRTARDEAAVAGGERKLAHGDRGVNERWGQRAIASEQD